MTFSALSDFREQVRAIMGDLRAPHQYEDAALDGVMRTVVRCGRVPGLAISNDGQSVVPGIDSPRLMARLVYHSAFTLLLPKVRGESWGSRALKVRRSDQKDFLRQLENLLYYEENPEQLATFQSYFAWVNSLAGVNLFGLMTQMHTHAPVANVTVGAAGITTSTT